MEEIDIVVNSSDLDIAVSVENSVVQEIIEIPVEKRKFGVSIDNLLGDVDENGTYVIPKKDIVLDLTGVTNFTYGSGLAYKFYGAVGNIKVIANGVQEIKGSAFANFCENTSGDSLEMYFDSITSMTSSPFQGAANGCYFNNIIISFAELETINSSYAFQNFFGSSNSSEVKIDLDAIFPKLKHISGTSVFYGFCPQSMLENGRITLSKVETIIGATSNTLSTFSYISADIYLPSCTLVENYICRTANTNALHFAAANQAAIEACTGYANKFGADEIYFDL